MPAQSTTDELFPETPTGRQPVVAFPFTIRARLGAWPVELVITAKPAELGRYLARLEELGYTPDVPAPAAPAPYAQVRKPRRAQQEPTYDGEGDPCCPEHGRKLKAGKWGLFCTHQNRDTGEYCKYTYRDADAAA